MDKRFFVIFKLKIGNLSPNFWHFKIKDLFSLKKKNLSTHLLKAITNYNINILNFGMILNQKDEIKN